ncbi:starch synthase [Methylacidimicrobium cyclopophantes]|uniref:Glycogen synthase n=1 Tax=Methylacidimicrobium cyclopophantes TaxID=1041766 RepID=A0A5E6M6X7_9BACT|nr:glycogen/starch synthase [Methylacidimicrobium cyclopophantes]VVM04701.1 starch synthase [Methylacidimicrobium cyclopophantes]
MKPSERSSKKQSRPSEKRAKWTLASDKQEAPLPESTELQQIADEALQAASEKKAPRSQKARSRPVVARRRVAPPAPPQESRRKIVFVAAECAPLAKVGGVGDAVEGLALALARRGHQVRVILPFYAGIDRSKIVTSLLGSCCVHMGAGQEHWIAVWETFLGEERVPVWLVDYQSYFGRPGVYDEPTGEYADNAYRFALLAKAALEICKSLAFIPDLFHVHDWPAALVPVFLKAWPHLLSPFGKTATVLTLHNVGHQGKYGSSVMPYLGLEWTRFQPDFIEDYGQVNLLKAGVHDADFLTTVSPAYADEILEPVGGCGLAPFFARRKNDLRGILNGVEETRWDPEVDPLLPANFSARNLSGKSRCKEALQRRMGLPARSDLPLFAMVSRLHLQKGIHLVRDALPSLLREESIQCVFLGSGEAEFEEFLRGLARTFPDQVAASVGFSEELSHWIFAGSDFFLMPSLYEPCGLSQLYAMRYGSIPVARATGGIRNTVIDLEDKERPGTGLLFLEPTGQGLTAACRRAIDLWEKAPETLTALRVEGMKQLFSWTRTAREYEEVYTEALRRRGVSAGSTG